MVKKGKYKKCEFCGKEFYVSRCNIMKRKYCCNNCRIKAQKTDKNIQRKRKIIKCYECGVGFEVVPSSKRMFCTHQCSVNYNKKNHSKVDNRYEKECLNCGEKYLVHKYRYNTSKFCSNKCFNEYRNDKILCPSCDKYFSAPKFEKRKYCSVECFEKGVSKRKSKLFLEIYDFIKNKGFNIKYEEPIKGDDFRYSVDIIYGNKIIECYGDYWHCNPNKYSSEYFHSKIRKTANDIWENDKLRVNKLKGSGYIILEIWEYDWFKNNNSSRNKIIKFLEK